MQSNRTFGESMSSLLFAGAHTDDIELLSGGTLSRFSDGAHCIVFSCHRTVSDSHAAHLECKESFEGIFGLDSSQFDIFDLGACNGDFLAERSFVYEELRKIRDSSRCPDVVVTHSSHDTNQDHQQVAAEVNRVFKSHASILQGEFLNNDLGDQNKNYYVELSEDDIENKVKGILHYHSQQINSRTYFNEEFIRGHASVLGMQINTKFAEVFSAVRVKI